MKLLLDEQISHKVAEQMSKQGIDVVAVTADPALRGLSDPDVFAAAQQLQRVVVTYNRVDFERIVREYAAAGDDHHGLVIVHPGRFPNHQFTRLANALVNHSMAFPRGGSFVVWLQEP